MKIIYLIVFMIFSTINVSVSQEINIGHKDSLQSINLQENRPLSIYLPPSYYSKPTQNYPVLYILDGDYNFQYVSGILELQAGIAENIPEMILVAISGKGSRNYKKNCKPYVHGVEESGNADQVLEFIEKELTPYIDSKYRTLDYKILAGHSIGGLFIINSALKKTNFI
ncbi:alpha/beta hydrolase [Gillisia marina]|uniref:alpha/beta hydrolase n=1 Tax=Gillisia marina TaxID=1167637 RepID=UPI000299DE6F|nr:alpha/beta hydrolase-fold protein [Gillisia marina]